MTPFIAEPGQFTAVRVAENMFRHRSARLARDAGADKAIRPLLAYGESPYLPPQLALLPPRLDR